MGCAAALATIELIEQEYMQNAAEVGEYAMTKLAEMKEKHPSIGDVRGKGLMIGIDFVKQDGSLDGDEAMRDKVVNEAFPRGLLLLGCGKSTIRISPPLCISRAEIDEGLEVFEEALTYCEG